MLKSIQKPIIYDSLFSLLTAFIVFDFKIANLVLGGLILFFLIAHRLSFSLAKSTIKSPIFISFCIFLFFVLINSLFYQTFSDKRNGMYFIIPIVWILGSAVQNWRWVMNTFIFSLIGIIVFGTYNQVSYFLTSDNYNMATGSRVNDILILERPYLGFLCVIGILLSFHLYQKTKTKFYLFTTALFVIYPFVISARMSILSLILILIIYLFFNNKISFRTKAITTVGSATIIILLFALNPTLKSRLKVDSINVNDIETVKNADPRVIIWSCSYSIFTSDAYNLWLGINSKQKLEDQLVDCYKQDKTNLDRRDYFVSEKFNTHNQFIDLLLLNGFVGLILFLIMLYYVLKTSENTAIYLSLALLFFMFVENILARQMGIYLFALVIVFVFVLSNIYPKRESLSAT